MASDGDAHQPPITEKTMVTDEQPITEQMTKAGESSQAIINLDTSQPVANHPMNTSMSVAELALLAQLEEANKVLEQDQKTVANVSPENSINGEKKPASSSDTVSICSSVSQQSNLPTENELQENPPATPEEEMMSSWSKMLSDWETISKKRSQYIKDVVRQGVPHQFRCLAWQYLCGADHCPAKEKYSTYLRQTSACEKVIRRDIARTYPEHEFFREKDGLGQESLFNVMKAYSLHDREVGYCQGSAFIVGLLLMIMPEEEAFTVLVQMMREYRLRELFKPTMAELGLCMYQLEYLIQEHLPSLYLHFQAQSFHTSMYASGWFLTLFTTHLPLKLCFRIMDIFLSEGMEIIFRVGVAILILGESDLLCMDMEGMLLYFQDKVPVLYASDEGDLLSCAMQIQYNGKRMKKLEKEYSLLKAKESEEQVELRRLRSENRLLRQRIENLEKENVTLADRLIQGQVTLAQEAEDMFVIKRELSQLREQNNELSRSLSASTQQIDEMKSSQGAHNRFYARSLSVPVDDSLYHHVRDLHMALDDLHRSMSTVTDVTEVDSSDRYQTLQEELIAVKLREAEANLALRELTNHVAELDREWAKQMERTPKDKLSKTQTQALHDEMMSCKLKEAETSTQNKHFKLKVMELETAAQINSNQIQRLLDENERLRGESANSRDTEQTLKYEITELENKLDDLNTKAKEECVITKINEAEHSQMVAELRQKIAELEIKNQECVITNTIVHQSGKQSLHNEIADLKDELLQYKLQSSPLTFSTLDIHKGSMDSGSDGDESVVSAQNGLSNPPQMSESIDMPHHQNGDTTPVNGSNSKRAVKSLTSMDMDSSIELTTGSDFQNS